jgi:hypothetical protein
MNIEELEKTNKLLKDQIDLILTLNDLYEKYVDFLKIADECLNKYPKLKYPEHPETPVAPYVPFPPWTITGTTCSEAITIEKKEDF